VRYAVVAEVLGRHIDALAASTRAGLRVLDVGGGDGMDSIPLAAAGHQVTILDPSRDWLEEAQRRAARAGTALTTINGGLDSLPPGKWDLVLCHFVLRYRSGEEPDIAELTSRVRPGGRLSVMDVNPAGRVLRALVSGGPSAASAELAAERASVETFQTDARKVEWGDVWTQMEDTGLRVLGLYANRIANDLLVDDTAKHDDAFFADLLELELALCDRPPYNQVGFAWQLVAERPR
jgi:S-adenosylmethionine-dependent methyltransferase